MSARLRCEHCGRELIGRAHPLVLLLDHITAGQCRPRRRTRGR